MDFSAIFHQIATWSFRAAIAGGLVAVVYLAQRGDTDLPGARIVAAERAAASGVTPCQPIGQMADGELVYSMDCESLPSPAVTSGPAASAD